MQITSIFFKLYFEKEGKPRMRRSLGHIDLQGSLYGIRGQRSADLFSFLVSFVFECCIHTHLS